MVTASAASEWLAVASATVALYGLEPIVGIGRGGCGRRGLGLVISPRRVTGGGGSSVGGSLALRNLGSLGNLDPLLGSGEIVTCVPLILSGRVGGIVADVCVRDWGICLLDNGCSVELTVGQSSVGACINFGQTRVGNSGIGLDKVSRLDGSIFVGGGIGGRDLGSTSLCLGNTLFSNVLGSDLDVLEGELLDRCDCYILAYWKVMFQFGQRLTSSCQRRSVNAAGGVLSALVQLDHDVHSTLITTIDTEQNALCSQVSILGRELSLLAAVGGEAKEFGQNEEAVLQRLLGLGLSLALGFSNGLCQLLLMLLGQGLLQLLLGLFQTRTPLFVQLQDLGKVFLISGEFGLEGGFVVDLSLLVGVDDLGSNELLNGLVLVLGNQRLGL